MDGGRRQDQGRVRKTVARANRSARRQQVFDQIRAAALYGFEEHEIEIAQQRLLRQPLPLGLQILADKGIAARRRDRTRSTRR